MRKDQIRLFSAFIVAGLLCTWWNVFGFVITERSFTYVNETWLAKGHAIPTADATFIMLDYNKMRVFLDLWKGLIVLAASACIAFVWIARAWTLAALSLVALAAYAGFLTFHWSTFHLSQVFGTNFVTEEYVTHLREALGRWLAMQRLEEGWDAVPWIVDFVFVRIPIFVSLVVFPLVSLVELARGWRAGRRREAPTPVSVEPFQAA